VIPSPAGPAGLGITDVGNEEANSALKNCDDNGFSAMMFDYVYAHRCSDNNFMQKAVPAIYGGDVAAAGAEERAKCEHDLDAFEKNQKEEQQNYQAAVKLALKSRNGGLGSMANPQAVKY
jgi:hypothetical protein